MPAHNSEIAQCEAILRAFEDKFWCLEALNTFPHAVNWNGAMKNVDKNERLAKFGDSLLLKSLCQAWYETSGDAGDWKYIQDNVLTNENLEGVGRNHGLDKCVITNPGTYGVSRRTMATTVEALLAAAWYDGGEGALTAVLIKLGLDYETSILTDAWRRLRTVAKNPRFAPSMRNPALFREAAEGFTYAYMAVVDSLLTKITGFVIEGASQGLFTAELSRLHATWSTTPAHHADMRWYVADMFFRNGIAAPPLSIPCCRILVDVPALCD